MPPKGSNRSENLIRRTRKLINGYPKNSILKEFLQNADDAKATELIITYDARIHTSLDNTDLSPAKGPALLICNNAKFKGKDFDAIVEIGAEDSKQDDATSTGRFGEGFNSSFSISDHPSLVSNGRAYWFDILREAVSKKTGSPDTPYWEKDDFYEIQDWLDVFSVGSENYFKSYDTVFRLPLRNSKTESRISNEIFSLNDFLEWVDEWKTNASQLLFLRHVQRLVLQEVSKNNITITHLEIKTINESEILNINNSIQDEFIKSPLEICRNWKDNTEELPRFRYKHHFSIDYFDREKQCNENFEECWAVINGLFRGESNSLINHAIKALEIKPEPRKVMPWAGVAIRLDDKGKPQKTESSQYFTFLPLPIPSQNPVHIHGWFEINSERTQITCVESGEDLEILTEWNKLLFEQGVGVAWAYLIDYIKKECLANSYYTFWPKDNGDQFDRHLLTGFYNKISELKCFKTSYKNDTQWNTPKDDIYYLQRGIGKNLFNAFHEHFYLITDKPNTSIIKGLADVDVALREIEPKFIREFLLAEATKINFPINFNDVPIRMLSRKEWLLAVLVFCAEAEEDNDYSYLNELPLKLVSNNELYRVGGRCLVDEKPNFSIFDGNKALFIDAEIVKIVKGAEVLPSSWYRPTLKNYLMVLHDYIDKYDLKNKAWLESLITLIIETDEAQADEAVDELHQLQVVYQYGNSFGFLEPKVGSPVLVPNEEISNIPHLAKTEMPLVHPDYIDIYSPLTQLKGVDLITKLTPFSLIRYLVHIPEEKYIFFEERELREYLIDFISKDISWFDELNDDEKQRLMNMPLIATESGNVFSRNDNKKLFLPAGFTPPENVKSLKGEYELIKIIDENQQALYKKMGFKEQNPINYLEEVIIPFIEGSQYFINDVVSILEWLANEWVQITSHITKEEKGKLTKRLSESKIILDSGNSLNTASNYYHPVFISKLPIFLQNKKYSPLSFESENTQDNWEKLLSELGASQEIIAPHIIDTVKSISEDKSYKKSIELLNYISNNFESFDVMEYQNKLIFEYLSDLAWIPAEKPKEILRPRDEYEVLRKPSEIILAKDYMIAGGCHYSLSSEVKLGKKDGKGEFSKVEMAKKIKLLVSLPASSVFDSFLLLREIAIKGQEKKISDYAKAFYKYVGRLSFDEVRDDIKDKSIFIMGHWLPSNKVFQSPPTHLSGIYSWDTLVKNDDTESSLAKGLINLGVLDRPSNQYLVNYLHNIPQRKKLNEQQLKESKAILKHFQDSLEELEINDIPFISRSNKLINAGALYIKNLPAYDKSEKRNDQLEFCQQQFEKLAKHCDVFSLADNVMPQLDDKNSQDSQIENNSWNDYIRSDSFKLAILRLIYHDGEISDDEIEQESVDKVLPSKILLMDALVVKYYINETWIYDDLETSTYQDSENSILYLLNQDDEEDMCESIAKFIQSSSNLSSDSLFLIARILRNKLNTSVKIQGLLDDKNIKSLPENIEVDEDISLYGDNTKASNNDLDDSTSHDEEIEQDDPSSDDYNQENEQSPSGDHHNIDTRPSKKIEPEESDDEIPPPTKPKQSKSQDASDMSPGDHNPNTRYSGDHSWQDNNANRGSQRGEGGSRGEDTSRQGISNRSKKSSNSNLVSPNNRMPVYVGKEKELDQARTDEERKFSKKIGNKGEKYVLDHSQDYLFSISNRFVKAAADNNKGYDIIEVDSSGKIIRFIEVKTLTGKWGEGGVGITGSQLEFAQVYDNWWLFVVENINTENTQVHILDNPVLQANRFMFDHSWKQLAVKTEEDINPQSGEKYLLSNGMYEIISVIPMGVFFKVKLKNILSDKIETKKFDPSWEKF